MIHGHKTVAVFFCFSRRRQESCLRNWTWSRAFQHKGRCKQGSNSNSTSVSMPANICRGLIWKKWTAIQWGRRGEMKFRTKCTHEMRGRPTWTRRDFVADVEITPSKPGRQPIGGISSVVEAKGQLQGCLESSRSWQNWGNRGKNEKIYCLLQDPSLTAGVFRVQIHVLEFRSWKNSGDPGEQDKYPKARFDGWSETYRKK